MTNINQRKTVLLLKKICWTVDTQYHIMNGNKTYFRILNSINDSGEIFESNLTFRDRTAQKSK